MSSVEPLKYRVEIGRHVPDKDKLCSIMFAVGWDRNIV